MLLSYQESLDNDRDLSSLVLQRLRLEAALPVNSAITRFSHAPVPPAESHISISHSPPTILTTLHTIDTCYNVWLALPIPNSSQLSRIQQSLVSFQVSASAISPTLSLQVTFSSQMIHLPVWVVNVWPRLHSIVSHCQVWASARCMLRTLANSVGPDQAEAREILHHLSVIPVDSPIASLAPFSTSALPTLLLDEWISDDHINAIVQLINMDPQRRPHIHVVDTFLLLSLQHNFERSITWAPRRKSTLDISVQNGSASELLVPVHRPSHWTLLHIDVTSRLYSYADTLQPNNVTAPPECIDLLNRWLSAVLGAVVVLLPSPRPFDLDQQLDSHSCGVAVASTMASYAIGHRFSPWSQSSAKLHRIRWGLLLINSGNHEVVFEAPVTPGATTTKHESGPVQIVSSTTTQHNRTPLPEPSFSIINTEPDLESSSDMDDPFLGRQLEVKLSKQPQQLTQSMLPFKPIPLEQWRAKEAERYQDRRVENQDRLERLKLEQVQLTIARRRIERDRKRVQRERQKGLRTAMAQAAEEPLKPQASLPVPIHNFPVCMRDKLAAISRDRLHDIRNLSTEPNPVQDIAEVTQRPTTAHRVNWCHPLIWPLIERTAHEVGWPWSPAEIVRRLQLKNPDIFATLRPQRISQWRDHGSSANLKWTDAHLQAIEAGSRRALEAKGGRKGIFHNHPQVVQSITSCLADLRKAGMGLSLGTIRGYMVGVIHHYIPDAFTPTDRSGRLFRCSDQFTRRFLHQQLKWSIRKATRAAQKYPPNVNTVLLNAFLRFACVVRDENVPSCCIVNADQTQVVYNPGDKKTWNPTGERQVPLVGFEDKRAFTVLMSASNSGDILSPQAVYTGKSPRSVPSDSAPGYQEAQQLGLLLEFSKTSTYWSTFETMCSWVTKILAPYFISQRTRHKLPDSQRCILQIDCWSVHRSAKFRTWMAENYPWIIILFVPGGCTGLFQACDVGLQRVLKLAITKAAHADVVVETVNALRSGTPPEQIRNDQSLPTLRDRSLNWILQGFSAINKPELVRQAFKLCAVPGTEHNLSYESLTSHTARQAILELRATNPDLYADITSGHHPPPRATVEDDITPDADDGAENEDTDHTVDDVRTAILRAGTAVEVAQPLEPAPEYDDSEEPAGSVDEAVVLPISTRSGRIPRASLRYSGSHWRRH